jgi:pectate lyase-like protein/parallel beta helix pectate lyase-like protein
VAEDLINLTPGTSPPSPNIEALIDSGDPNTITDTDLANAPIGSLLIRRDGIPGGFLYEKTAASTWTANDRFYDVKVYGAVGNDTADDTNAFQNAINAAGAGGTVYVPPGKYLITNSLLFQQSYTALQLASGATLDYNQTKRTPTGSTNAIVFENTHGGSQPVGCALRGESAATSVITCVTGVTAVIACSNCVITDVTIAGAGVGSGGNAITSGNTVEVTISRCVLTGFDDGINSGDTSARWTITDNIVRSCNVDGIYMAAGTTDFIITGNFVSSIGHNGIDMNGGNHIIANNVVQSCGIQREGQQSDFWGILLQPVPGYAVSGCVVIGNSVSSCVGAGITVRAWSPPSTGNNNLVIGNVVSACGGGITLDAGGDTGDINQNAVIGNIVQGNPGGGGIYLYGPSITMQRTLVADNLVTGNGNGQAGNNGIQAGPYGGITDTQIIDNVVVGNADGSPANQIVATAPRSTVAGNKTETSDGNYTIRTTYTATTPVTVLVENTAGGATIFNIEGTGSQYQVNGTPI